MFSDDVKCVAGERCPMMLHYSLSIPNPQGDDALFANMDGVCIYTCGSLQRASCLTGKADEPDCGSSGWSFIIEAYRHVCTRSHTERMRCIERLIICHNG